MKKEINMLKNKKNTDETSKQLSFAADNRINTDPDGMWTGVSSENKYEEPIQDVDDL